MYLQNGNSFILRDGIISFWKIIFYGVGNVAISSLPPTQRFKSALLHLAAENTNHTLLAQVVDLTWQGFRRGRTLFSNMFLCHLWVFKISFL